MSTYPIPSTFTSHLPVYLGYVLILWKFKYMLQKCYHDLHTSSSVPARQLLPNRIIAHCERDRSPGDGLALWALWYKQGLRTVYDDTGNQKLRNWPFWTEREVERFWWLFLKRWLYSVLWIIMMMLRPMRNCLQFCSDQSAESTDWSKHMNHHDSFWIIVIHMQRYESSWWCSNQWGVLSNAALTNQKRVLPLYHRFLESRLWITCISYVILNNTAFLDFVWCIDMFLARTPQVLSKLSWKYVILKICYLKPRDTLDFLYGMACQTHLWSAPMRKHVA